MRKLLFISSGIILCAVFLISGYKIKNYHAHKIEKKTPPYLTLIGIVKMADGVGRHCVEVMQGLYDHVEINFISTGDTNLADVPHHIKKIIKKNSPEFGKVILFQDVLWSPGAKAWKIFETPSQQDQIKIAYSVFESSKIPYEWTLILNTFFDAVAVPDKFLIEVYKNSGVTIPIFEVPLGLDLAMYLKEPLKKARNSPMVFANFSACSDRKNLITLVHAFNKAFGNNPNVHLKINCRYSDKDMNKLLKKEIKRLNLSNVFFSELCFEAVSYIKMFKSIDCYVTLSKGEGFSIQPREAMALGIPVIATDNSAQKTICESQLVKSLSSPILEPAIYWDNEEVGYFANCHIDEAADALKDMYENYDQYLKNAQEARNWAKNYTFETLRPIYLNLIAPKEVILGKENKITSDYLMTNSPELYQKYLNIKQFSKKPQSKVSKKTNKKNKRSTQYRL